MLHSAIKIALTEFEKIAADENKKLFGESSFEYFLQQFQFSLEKRKKFADRKTGFSNLDDEMGKDELYSKRTYRAVFLLESLHGSRELEQPLTSTQILRSKFYDHKDNFDIDKILARLDKICAKLDTPPVICINYLQILASNTEKTKASIDDILRRLKNFQRKTNSTFIVINSLNHFNYYSDISFEGFKESGKIEYSADVIWKSQFLLDESNYQSVEKAKRENPSHVQLKYLKNLFGFNFDICFFYFPASVFSILCLTGFTPIPFRFYSRKV